MWKLIQYQSGDAMVVDDGGVGVALLFCSRFEFVCLSHVYSIKHNKHLVSMSSHENREIPERRVPI